MVTRHGRATPLGWMTVKKSTLEGKRGDYETQLIERLVAAIAKDVSVVLWPTAASAIRSGTPTSGSSAGTTSSGSVGILSGGRPGRAAPACRGLGPQDRTRHDAGRSARDAGPRRGAGGEASVVHAAKMKEAVVSGDVVVCQVPRRTWSRSSGKRFTIEETFRDRQGHSLRDGPERDAHPRRRSPRPLLLLAAIAHALLTLLGAASEATGMDRYLKRQYIQANAPICSLPPRQPIGTGAIPNMRDDWLQRTSWRLSRPHSSPSTPLSSARDSTRS